MKRTAAQQDGVTAVEYGIISAVVAAGFLVLGPWLAGVMLDLLDMIVGTMQ